MIVLGGRDVDGLDIIGFEVNIWLSTSTAVQSQ